MAKKKRGLNIRTHDDFNGKEYGEMLEYNGYELNRMRGSHMIYTKKGCDPITIKNKVNAMWGIRLIKQQNLIYEW